MGRAEKVKKTGLFNLNPLAKENMMNKMKCKSSTALLALSVLSMSICVEPAFAATPVNCGDNLNAPGQYILTENLICSSDTAAVTITANDVHFNLSGFTIDGGGGDSRFGIDSCSETTGVQISNGTVTGFLDGIRLCSATNAHIKGMTLTENGVGIQLASSDNNKITSNTVTDSVQGIRLANGSDNNQITDNTLTDTVDAGLSIFDGVGNEATGNTANNNVDGIALTGGSSSNNRVQGNTANGNEDDGIDLDSSADNNTVKGNTTNRNNSSGIEVSSGAAGNLLQGNTSRNNVEKDMTDLNIPSCFNTWKGNTFVTDNEGDGRRAGCIR